MPQTEPDSRTFRTRGSPATPAKPPECPDDALSNHPAQQATSGHWFSVPSPLQITGLNALGQVFRSRNLVEGLVRESLQNSLDAALDSKSPRVTVRFSRFAVAPRDIPDADRLRDIFARCRDFSGRSRAERGFFQMGHDLLLGDRIPVLRIADYGTRGLSGALTNAPGSRWRALVMTTGAGNNDNARGGGFGLGKEALFLPSQLRTLFFSTLAAEEDAAAHMGRSCLATFQDDNQQNTDANLFYCRDGYEPGNPAGVPALPGPLALPGVPLRQPGEYGTDIFILGFAFEEDDDRLSAYILGETLKSFMVALYDGELTVELPNGRRVTRETLASDLDWYRPYATNAQKNWKYVSEMYALATQPWKPTPDVFQPAPQPDGLLPLFPAGGILYKFKRSAYDINACAVTRLKGMTVHLVKNVCGTTAAIGICKIVDTTLNERFKAMENARHDQFEVTNGRFPDAGRRREAKLYLRTLKECLQKWAEEEVGEKPEDLTAAELPEELEELLATNIGQLFSVQAQKRKKTNPNLDLGAVHIKRHKPKSASMNKATPANLDPTQSDAEENPGVRHTESRPNLRTRGSTNSKATHGNPNAPEANGFVLRPIDKPTFFAHGRADSGHYHFAFRVPRTKAKVCTCFASTAENDAHEPLKVRSVSATCDGQPLAAYADLNRTAVAFENVQVGQTVTAEIEFDVTHYCYTEIRYYEKKNV